MAETVKLLAPEKRVLVPAPEAGCSLAESITAEDVRALRKAHPGVPVVAYVNTTAAVKAEVDICCTSANAAQVVASLGVSKVIFVPDRHLAAQVAAEVDVELIVWPGACEVHERFSAADVRALRADDQLRIIAHPECREEVCTLADFVGSTAAMGRWIDVHEPKRVALITECSMGDNLRSSFPAVEFVRSCQLCPYMKQVDLPSIHACLVHGLHEVLIPEEIARRARLPIDRMLSIGRQDRV
jgi:quinolinate synthase